MLPEYTKVKKFYLVLVNKFIHSAVLIHRSIVLAIQYCMISLNNKAIVEERERDRTGYQKNPNGCQYNFNGGYLLSN